MIARAYGVAFQGVEARLVEVQCAVTPGLPAFSIVGLPDKAVSEARDRVRTALTSMAIALPSKRITINLSPADLPKVGSHFDLPIALALLAALEILPKDVVETVVALGEMSLDGSLVPVVGALPAAVAAAQDNRSLLCPAESGAEAAWVNACQVIAAKSLGDVVRHYTGQVPLSPAEPGEVAPIDHSRDLREVKGQERAKRALEFARNVLETLRQPLETGEVMISRANAHVKYPCRFMLVAAANPCKCGYLTDPARACARVPHCGEDYMGRISGPLMDRFDIRVDVPPVAYTDLDLPASGDSSATVAARVTQARKVQEARFSAHPEMLCNADAQGDMLEEMATPDAEGRDLLMRAAERFALSARGYHRVLRVARTIADLDGSADVRKPHIAEAVSFRLPSFAVA
jgi:predicted ATPase with chaperone activity